MKTSRDTISIDQAKRPLFAGIDLGGTNIKVGLVDDDGRLLAYESVPSEIEKGPDDGARRMANAVRSATEAAHVSLEDVARVGLGTPGTMDIPGGLLLEPHNLPGWFHFPIRDHVSQHCGRPVTFTNDANAAAYGEYWVGSGREFASMILLTLGTGVGGGIIVGDMIIEGENSAGAECGHTIVDSRDDARMCACGLRGHLEAYASATAVIKRTLDLLAAGRESSLTGAIAAGEDVTPLLVAQHAEGGDDLSTEIIVEVARYLGIGITNLAHVIDPSAVVLGGAMTFGRDGNPVGRRFLEQVRSEVRERAMPVVGENLKIEFASLGGDAGFYGAAGIARVEHYKN